MYKKLVELNHEEVAEALLKVRFSKNLRDFKRIIDSFEDTNNLKNTLEKLTSEIKSNIIEFYNNIDNNIFSSLDNYIYIQETTELLFNEEYLEDIGGVFGFLPTLVASICPDIRNLCKIPMDASGASSFSFSDIDKDFYYFQDDNLLELFKEGRLEEDLFENAHITFFIEVQCPEVSKYIKSIIHDDFLLKVMLWTISNIFVADCSGLFFFKGNPVFLLSTYHETLIATNIYSSLPFIALDIFLAIIELHLIRDYTKAGNTEKFIEYIKHSFK